MSKHKKTLKQKIIADYRRSLYTFENKSNFPSDISKTATIPSNVYSYVLKDIFKTTFLTTSIVLAELILFFSLKNHILKIPGIIY